MAIRTDIYSKDFPVPHFPSSQEAVPLPPPPEEYAKRFGTTTEAARRSVGALPQATPPQGAQQAVIPESVVPQAAQQEVSPIRAVSQTDQQGAPFSYVEQLRRLREIDPEKYGAPQQAIGGQPEAAPQINYGGGWGDYLSSIAPATAANKSRRIAQEQAGQERLGAQRERGALSRVEREAELRRQAAGEEREYGLPEREARIGESQARAKLLGTQEEVAQLGMVDAREYAHLKAQVEDEALAKSNPALVQKSRERLKAIEEKAMRQKIAIEAAKQKAIMGEDYADGGVVRGYADGGAIGRAQTQQLNPLVSQYGQYLQAAAQTGVAPVPFTQYINLLSSTRGAMNQTPTQFADGGDVSDLSRPLEGPGTGRSDSIPAVIDGEQPAALSRGEFVIPEHVVRKKGTEFFEKLIAQYSEGVPANG